MSCDRASAERRPSKLRHCSPSLAAAKALKVSKSWTNSLTTTGLLWPSNSRRRTNSSAARYVGPGDATVRLRAVVSNSARPYL